MWADFDIRVSITAYVHLSITSALFVAYSEQIYSSIEDYIAHRNLLAGATIGEVEVTKNGEIREY